MKKAIYLILLSIFFVSTNNVLHAQYKHRKENPHAPGEDIYKHYTGTIGDRRIALDLRYGYQGASNYGGSRYYDLDKEGTTLLMIYEPATFDHYVNMMGEEEKEPDTLEERNHDSYIPAPRWTFIITDDKLTGMWHSADKRDSMKIDLTEDYSKSYAMNVVYINDSTEHFIGVRPLGGTLEERDFIGQAEDKLIGKSAKNNTDKQAKMSYYLWPVYNDNGMLVLKKEEGATGTQTITYLCLDVRNKKVWSINDVLTVDRTKLPALLETAIRKQYKLDRGKKLRTWLSVDKMPVPHTVMITHKGLSFTYYPGEIYSGTTLDPSREAITVFVPYTQLNDLLKPDFKKRMNL